MNTNILTEIELFFIEEKLSEDEIAKFYLSPDEVRFYTWQLNKYRKQYQEKRG